MLRKAVSICIFLFLSDSNCGYAQMSIGGGFEYGTAAFINKGIFVKRPSIGISGMISYAGRESKLFPSFTYLLKNIVVPVDNNYYTGVEDFAKDQHFALNLNYRTTFESDYYQLFMGVGIAHISPEKNLSDGQGNAMTLTDTASVSIYPLIQAGVKYMHRILPNSSFYVGIEANLKYIRMHSENVFYLQQGTGSVKATIAGDIIFPGVQIHLDYFFDRNEE